MRNSAIFIALLVLAACSRDAGVPTAEENRQLDDTANLLNEAPANLDAIDDSALAAENGPEAAESNETP